MRLIARRWLALATTSMGLYLALPDRGFAQNDEGPRITLGTLKGTYVGAFSGNIVDASGNLIAFTVAVRETYFGNGTASGVTTFVFQGQAVQSRVTFTGTYTVNADGSVLETDTQSNGFVLHFEEYPTPDGDTIAGIQTDPGVLSYSVLTRGPLERREP